MNSPLLSLPPELRTMIYELVLIEPSGVSVSPKVNPAQPALLAVCNSIRNEAVGIYFSLNNFEIDVTEYYSDLVLRWYQIRQTHLIQPVNSNPLKRALGTVKYVRPDIGSTGSLYAWVRAVHRREILDDGVARGERTHDFKATNRMYKFAVRARGLPWDSINMFVSRAV